MQFTHLHNHSQFSLLDGASSIPKLYDKARGDGMPALALTDHGNMFGVFQFVAEAWKNTRVVGKDEQGREIKEPVVKPIVGCEFYVVEDHSVKEFKRSEGKRDRRYHQLMLAKNEQGYKNLVKLCSLGYMDGLYSKYPRIDKEQIEKYHEGLIATTCCIAARVPQKILLEGEAAAEEEFKWWLDLFGDDYYIEIQRHGLAEQEQINEVLMRFSEKYGVPLIATNDSHYVDQEDANAHDILLCINTGSKQSTPKFDDMAEEENEGVRQKTRFGFPNNEFYFKTKSEMEQRYKDIPQALANTQMIVDKVVPLKLEKEILLPHFQVPDHFNDDQDAYLEHLTRKGAKERYKEITPEIEERLAFELFTIRTMGFAGYFLIVSDFIHAGRQMGVAIGPGRGSAAGSVVAYCIGITNIDPIKYGLLFERFLNPERKSMPDIDTDFEDSGRQKVIDYVVHKYGRNQVAQIVTYGTMAAKSSIKDVARVLDLPLAESNSLAKLVPEKPGISLRRVMTAPLDESIPDVKSLIDQEQLSEEELVKVEQLRAIDQDPEHPLHELLEEAKYRTEYDYAIDMILGAAQQKGMSAEQAGDLTNLLPKNKKVSLNRLLYAEITKTVKGTKSLKEKEGLNEEELGNVQQLRSIWQEGNTLAAEVLESAQKLEGSVRNTGMHAAGIIIAPTDLSDLLPVSTQKDNPLLITQYDGSVIESAGVIKMDFLGLKNLSIIKDALAIIKKNHNLDIDIEAIPLDDPKTLELFQAGNTNGIFQFESVGMQRSLRELKPDSFKDLIAMNALYRPGPIAYIPNYIRRKHGEEAITYDLPEMEEYLADTYGITVYQEQVMLLAQKLAGFSKGDADVLRKAMGKKKIETLNEMEKQFVKGAKEKGHPEKALKKIWEDWKAFAQYAFNKSHSTCYAFVAFQTAYLKAHYPSEYMAAVMNNAGNIDKITFFMKECKSMGLEVLGPHINESDKSFSVNKAGVIRFGLSAIKGVGAGAVDEIINIREKDGDFVSPFDLTSRVNQRAVNKKALEALALAGAFDCFDKFHRAQYVYQNPATGQTGLETIIHFGQQYQVNQSTQSNSLFGDVVMPEIKEPEIAKCEPWAPLVSLEKEKELIGIYLSGHPLDDYEFEFANYGLKPIGQLEEYPKECPFRIAGIVTEAFHGKTKKGNNYGSLTLTDTTGSATFKIWDKQYLHFCDFIKPAERYLIEGIYEKKRYQEDEYDLKIRHILLLSKVKEQLTKEVALLFDLFNIDEETSSFLSKYVENNPGDTLIKLLVFDETSQERVMLVSREKIKLEDEFIQYFKKHKIPLYIIPKASF